MLYPVREKRSFRENVIEILPAMFDNMMELKVHVAGHPRRKEKLHRMRITGKPMRYVMEIVEPFLGKEFGKCLHEIKNIIELMGDIHDGDVFISELKTNLSEIRSYNRTKKRNTQKINTFGVAKLIHELGENRKKSYNKLCETFNRWDKENFRSRLEKSIHADRINELNYFNSRQ